MTEGIMGRLEGKVALVTGAGQGFGRECARIFAREGARVVVADVNPESGAETTGLIKGAGGEAMFVRADVSRAEDVKAMVGAAVEAFGGLDCAINNAVRTLPGRPLDEVPEEDWDAAIAVNLTGVFLCMKYEIKAMLARGGGAIVNVGSGGEHTGGRGLSYYYAAKHGLQGLTKCAALDYAKRGIRINVIGPGVMMTPLMEPAFEDPQRRAFLMSKSPMGRFAKPEEVAEAAVWLCTSQASLVHGHTLVADGGGVLA
jgi:NAD(P)-dependent dehydrogenase (short-subunit alcohol dehydrogenase family)